MSRAMRYYYDKNIILKTPGKRYVYRFICDLQGLLGFTSTEIQAMVTGTQGPQEVMTKCWGSYDSDLSIVFLCICYLLWSQNIVPSSLSVSDDALQLEPKIVQNILYLYFNYISLGIHSDKALVIKNSFQNFYSSSILEHDICRRSWIKQDQEIFKSWFNGIWCPPASVYK